MPDVGAALCWKRRVSRAIRPKKDYIKSYETYFANTLNFLIRVQAGMTLFPKVLWPFNYLTLTQNKPSQFFECYLLFDHLPDND